MEYQDGYDISFKFEGTELELLPSTYSFTIEDSIYDVYPKSEFIIKDDTGLLGEFLFTVEGAKYELSLGVENNFIKVPFIVQNDELYTNKTAGIINGDIKLNLIHEFRGEQDLKSAYHKDKISNIVNKLADPFPFFKKNIDSTGNSSEWYQLLKGQVNFIKENLLPFAYSSSANKSPFFFYIDNKNQYNFLNFSSLVKGANPIKLTLTAGTEQGSINTSILKISRLRKGMDITYNLRHRQIYNFDEETGDLLEQEDYIYDYPTNLKSLPIIANKDYVTDYYLLDDKNNDPVNKENLQGLLNNSIRNSLVLDRFLISLPLNPDIIAGIPVEIVLPTAEDSDSNDLNLSGIYIVEKSIHSWDSQRANTYAIIGRKDSFIPNSEYKMKRRLING